MTKDKFIAAIQTKPNFIKWAKTPVSVEALGSIEKWNGVAYIRTPDGTNLFQVWFIVDTSTGEATWQNGDTLEPEKNSISVKTQALEQYLKATFEAYFVTKISPNAAWAEAEVFSISGSNLVRSNVLVFKKGANPITHLPIA